MIADTSTDPRSHPMFAAHSFRICSKGPWAARKGEAESFGAFRRYVGEPKGGPLHELELCTELSLRLAERAGQLAELWQEASDCLAGQLEDQWAERSARVVQTLQRYVDDIMRPIAQRLSALPAEHGQRFAAASAAHVKLLGVQYDNAHAAAHAAASSMCELWDLVCELSSGAGALESALILHLLGEALEQLPGSDFRLILQQVRQEHLAARAAEEQCAPTDDGEHGAAVTRPHWSKSYPKSKLADFFGETIKTLCPYLERTAIRFRTVSRQSFIIDMHSLHPHVRERFLRELEARK